MPLSPTEYRTRLNDIWSYTVPEQWEEHIQYRQLYDVVRRTALPNYIAALRPVKSNLNIPPWRAMLVDYHNTTLVDLLEFGWPADYTTERPWCLQQQITERQSTTLTISGDMFAKRYSSGRCWALLMPRPSNRRLR